MSRCHPAEALLEPFSAFPSWFMRIECDRCGKIRMVNEVHAPRRDMPIREIIKRMRHDGCGGLASKVELLTGTSPCPVGRCGASCCWSREGRSGQHGGGNDNNQGQATCR
jgi:hypothetical protein